MLLLTRKLPKKFIIGDKEMKINLTFDNVLKFFELIESDDFDESKKLLLSFRLFFDRDLNEMNLSGLEALEAIKKVVGYINHNPYEDTSEEAETANNELLESDEYEPAAPSYSFKKDAALIYASFMKDYRIDLIKEQGKLRWEKFNALLNYLSDDTPFKQVISIRNKSLQDLEGDELNATIEMQERYSLLTLKEREEQAGANLAQGLSFLQNLADNSKE